MKPFNLKEWNKKWKGKSVTDIIIAGVDNKGAFDDLSSTCSGYFLTHEYKICVMCGAKFYRPFRYSKSAWSKRTTCSKSCGGYHAATHEREKPKMPTKECAICGKTITKRSSDSRERWNKRVACSRECLTKWQRTIKNKKFI